MEPRVVRLLAVPELQPRLRVGHRRVVLPLLSVSFALLLWPIVTFDSRHSAPAAVQPNHFRPINESSSATRHPQSAADRDCITEAGPCSDRDRRDRLDTADHAFRIVIKAFGDVSAPSSTTRFVVPAVSPVVLNIAPVPPNDLKIGLYVKWPGYGFKLAEIAAKTTTGLYAANSVQFRAPTTLAPTRGTLRVVVARTLREAPSEEELLMSARGIADFHFVVPQPQIQLVHACGSSINGTVLLPRCTPFTLDGRSSQVLSADKEKICIEVLASRGAHLSIVLLYGFANGDEWNGVAEDGEGLPKADRYTLRYGLVPPNYQGKACSVRMYPLIQSRDALSRKAKKVTFD